MLTLGATPALTRALGYPKFTRAHVCRVLVLYSGYHLQAECARALVALGHEVALVHIADLTCADAVRALLTQLVSHRPDFVLTINHLGFDEAGQVGELLADCKMPVACWYCDSPMFVLRGGALPAAAVTSLFVWERTLVPTLRALGAQDVHHLPLGCDIEAFGGPAPPSQTRSQAPAPRPMAFVGNSMRQACRDWTARLGAAEHKLAHTLREELTARPRAPLVESARDIQARQPEVQVWDALGAATFQATSALRDRLLRTLPAQDLHVFGDAGWQGVLDPAVTLHGPVAYGEPLAQVYGSTAINLNATSLQMPTAVNQRLFDVPAAGGFLLADAQDDVAELFVPGEEAITYGDKDELLELCRYYLPRPGARAQVVARAQARIRSSHTYTHRLAHVARVMRARYA